MPIRLLKAPAKTDHGDPNWRCDACDAFLCVFLCLAKLSAALFSHSWHYHDLQRNCETRPFTIHQVPTSSSGVSLSSACTATFALLPLELRQFVAWSALPDLGRENGHGPSRVMASPADCSSKSKARASLSAPPQGYLGRAVAAQRGVMRPISRATADAELP